MQRIMQTDFSFKTGNCGQACVASILEIKLKHVPQFHNPDDPADGVFYCEKIRKFLYGSGLSYIDIQMDGFDPREMLKGCWVIASGPSPRATEKWHRHAVVWKNGEIVHDPHPSGDGLASIDLYGVFIKKDPGDWG